MLIFILYNWENPTDPFSTLMEGFKYSHQWADEFNSLVDRLLIINLTDTMSGEGGDNNYGFGGQKELVDKKQE